MASPVGGAKPPSTPDDREPHAPRLTRSKAMREEPQAEEKPPHELERTKQRGDLPTKLQRRSAQREIQRDAIPQSSEVQESLASIEQMMLQVKSKAKTAQDRALHIEAQDLKKPSRKGPPKQVRFATLPTKPASGKHK